MAGMETQRVQRTLGIVVLVGLMAFLYQCAQLLQTVSDFRALYTDPPTVGDILFAVCTGLGAALACLGLDVPALIKGFQFGTGKGEDK